MKSTYEIMKEKAMNTDYDKDVEIHSLFMTEPDDAIAKFYCENIGLIRNLSSKYLSIDEDLKGGIALESIYQCFNTYKDGKGNTIVSHFRMIYSNKLKDEVKSQHRDKRKINKETSSLDSLKEKTDGEFGVTSSQSLTQNPEDNIVMDFNNFLNQFDFSDTQKNILRLYIDSAGRINQTDIAEELGVNKSTVSRNLNKVIKSAGAELRLYIKENC